MPTSTAHRPSATPRDASLPRNALALAVARHRADALAVLGWTTLVVACYWLAELGETVAVPAPELLVPLVVGAALALTGAVDRSFPKPAARASHALVGVVMGSYLDPGSLASVAAAALPLSTVTVATIAISVGAAVLLARSGGTTLTDAVLGMVPGGSAAVIACAEDLGADSRQVAFTQYLRVGLVALTAPLVASLIGGGAPPSSPDQLGAPALHHVVAAPSGIAQVLVLVAVCVLGAQAGTRLRLPSPVLLGPMLLTALLTLTDTFGGFAPAGPLRDVMFVVIGLEVGLRFTRAAVRHVRKLLPAILATVLVVCAVCAGLAWLLGAVEDIPFVESYLATTPGGINAVLATAAATDTDVPLVSTVQSMRLFVVVLVAPPILRWLTRRQQRPYHSDAAAGSP